MTAAPLLIALAAGLIVYGCFDPESGYFPACIVKKTTGFDCPGCGAQRAIHALLQGRLSEAWHFNALMFILTPVAIAAIIIDVRREQWPRLHRIMASKWTAAAIIAAITLWTIVRNL